MIGGPHEGFELARSYNLTHPGKYDDANFIWMCKMAVLKQPRYSGRVYKNAQPDLDIWSESDVYFTFYKGRGDKNYGDRMVNFYMKEPEFDIKNWFKEMAEDDEKDESLY